MMQHSIVTVCSINTEDHMCCCSVVIAAEHLLCEQYTCKTAAYKGSGGSMQKHMHGQQHMTGIASCKGSSSMPRQQHMQEHTEAIASCKNSSSVRRQRHISTCRVSRTLCLQAHSSRCLMHHAPPLHLPLIQITDQLHAAIGRHTTKMILVENNVPVGHCDCQTQ